MSSSVGDFLLDQDFQGALESVLHAGVIFIVGLLFRESNVRSMSSRFWRLHQFTGTFYTFVPSVKFKM